MLSFYSYTLVKGFELRLRPSFFSDLTMIITPLHWSLETAPILANWTLTGWYYHLVVCTSSRLHNHLYSPNVMRVIEELPRRHPHAALLVLIHVLVLHQHGIHTRRENVLAVLWHSQRVNIGFVLSEGLKSRETKCRCQTIVKLWMLCTNLWNGRSQSFLYYFIVVCFRY